MLWKEVPELHCFVVLGSNKISINYNSNLLFWRWHVSSSGRNSSFLLGAITRTWGEQATNGFSGVIPSKLFTYLGSKLQLLQSTLIPKMNSQFLVALETGLSWWIFMRLIKQPYGTCSHSDTHDAQSEFLGFHTNWSVKRKGFHGPSSSRTAPHPPCPQEIFAIISALLFQKSAQQFTNWDEHHQRWQLDHSLGTWRTLASRVGLTLFIVTYARGSTAATTVLLMEFPQHTSKTPNISSMFLMGILIIYHLDYQSCLICACANSEQTDTEQVT